MLVKNCSCKPATSQQCCILPSAMFYSFLQIWEYMVIYIDTQLYSSITTKALQWKHGHMNKNYNPEYTTLSHFVFVRMYTPTYTEQHNIADISAILEKVWSHRGLMELSKSYLKHLLSCLSLSLSLCMYVCVYVCIFPPFSHYYFSWWASSFISASLLFLAPLLPPPQLVM